MFDFLLNLWNKIVPEKPRVVVEKPVLEYQEYQFVDDLLFYHNTIRSNKLELSERLNKYAQYRAEYMARTHNVEHTSNNELRKLLSQNRWSTIAENIASGQTTPGSVMQSWLNSPGHRANIVNSRYSLVGFGCATDRNGKIYWCALFAG